MKIHRGILLILSILAFISCSEDPVSETSLYRLKGHIQKGPFINGSDITLFELKDNYSQSGKSFLSSTGTQGEFEFNGIELLSPYVEIKADGYYHNEIAGELSDGRIILKAITDISELDQVNVNILTHLEYERVKYLISNDDLTIGEAKQKAQAEILAIFCLDEYTLENSEILDVSLPEQGDAILLAISAILQGNHTSAELSLILANIISDMKEDGILNDTVIQSELLGQALALNCDQVGQNLISIYAGIGIDLEEINPFETYVNQFISQSSYSYSSPFDFPESTGNGLNVLDPAQTEFQIITGYAFAVDMPGAGKIVVKMRKTSGSGIWWYQPTHAYGWNVSNFDFNQNEQVFTSTLNGVTIDLPIEFSEYGKGIIEYYYNGAAVPSITKSISWGGQNNTDFIFPNDSPMGYNLLNLLDGTSLHSDSTYTVSLLKPGTWDVNFVLSYSDGISIEVPTGYGLYSYEDAGEQINFTLTGKDETDYISEIVFLLMGTGTLNLSSDAIEVEEGVLLNRDFILE